MVAGRRITQSSRTARQPTFLAIAAAARNPRLTHAIEDARVAMFQPVDALDFQFVKDASLDGHDALLDAGFGEP